MHEKLIDSLKKCVGDRGYLAGDDVGAKYYSDPRGTADVRPVLVLRPATTDELSRIMKLCHAAGQPVIAQGGMTGLVGAAKPLGNEIPITFERMNKIEELDTSSATMTVQSGVPLQAVQEYADAHGLLFPLDLGARGSCMIGGNLSTNAGGNRVIRYGMARDLVLGVEAVLADGTIVSSMSKFVKNNAGYDLKQLFVGSEGTLGMITRATLRLHPRPKSQVVAFCAVPSFDALVGFLHHVQSAMAGNLSAFEAIWQSTYIETINNVRGIKAPLPRGHPYYVLTEVMGGSQERDQDLLESVLADALENGLIADAVVSRSQSEIAGLWAVRDGAAEAMEALQPAVSFDVSLSISEMERFVSEVQDRISAAWSDARCFFFGHLGDGNLHLLVKTGSGAAQPYERIEAIVYGIVGELSGSISAEHGIGLMKRQHLPQSRSPAEMDLMRTLKRSLDPKGLLNPGRVFEM